MQNTTQPTNKKFNSMPKLQNARGDLTAYALSCGYVQRYEGNKNHAKLNWTHCCYNVKVFEKETDDCWSWETYRTLTEAQKALKSID
jgi:hypothetical protein